MRLSYSLSLSVTSHSSEDTFSCFVLGVYHQPQPTAEHVVTLSPSFFLRGAERAHFLSISQPNHAGPWKAVRHTHRLAPRSLAGISVQNLLSWMQGRNIRQNSQSRGSLVCVLHLRTISFGPELCSRSPLSSALFRPVNGSSPGRR